MGMQVKECNSGSDHSEDIMNDEKTHTSAMWQIIFPKMRVLDPDGWDRQNFEYSWYIEMITEAEYKRRRLMSTCVFEKNALHE